MKDDVRWIMELENPAFKREHELPDFPINGAPQNWRRRWSTNGNREILINESYQRLAKERKKNPVDIPDLGTEVKVVFQ